MEPLAIPLSNPKTVAKWLVIKIQSSPKCPTRGRRSATGKSIPCGVVSKAGKKFRSAAYGLYANKKFLVQRSMTSHLVAAVWQLSGMAITITNHLAACCLSEMASCFTNDLPSVFCWVSQMASSHISSFIKMVFLQDKYGSLAPVFYLCAIIAAWTIKQS